MFERDDGCVTSLCATDQADELHLIVGAAIAAHVQGDILAGTNAPRLGICEQ
jgi:hypothetical protein